MSILLAVKGHGARSISRSGSARDNGPGTVWLEADRPVRRRCRDDTGLNVEISAELRSRVVDDIVEHVSEL